MRTFAPIVAPAVVCGLLMVFCIASTQAAAGLKDQCRERLVAELAKVEVPAAALDLYRAAAARLPVASLAQWDALESSQRRSLEDVYPVRACESLIMAYDDALEAYKAPRGPCAHLAPQVDDELREQARAQDAHAAQVVEAKTACYVFG